MPNTTSLLPSSIKHFSDQYSAHRRNYSQYILYKTPKCISKIFICIVIIVLISSRVATAHESSEESSTSENNIKEEEPPKPKDKLWKKILREIFYPADKIK